MQANLKLAIKQIQITQYPEYTGNNLQNLNPKTNL